MPYLTRQKFPIPLDRDRVTQDWGQRGYSCDVFTDPPGKEWNNFVHATNELVTVMDGRLKLTIDGQEIIAEPGTKYLSRNASCIPSRIFPPLQRAGCMDMIRRERFAKYLLPD